MSLQINIIAASPDEVLSDCHNQELTLVNESLASQSASELLILHRKVLGKKVLFFIHMFITIISFYISMFISR